MYCPNCGAGYFDPDSNFCPECGTQLSNFQGQKHSMQSNMTQSVQVQQKIAYQPLKTPLYQYPSNEIGSYSKRALGFSIASLCFLVAGLIIGGATISLILNTVRRYSYTYYYTSFYLTPAMGFAGLIPAIALNGVGLIFAIIARVYASKAKSEMVNTARKVGGVFSILGIVFNSIALAAGLILGPLILFNALRLFGFYPYPYYV